MIDPQTGYNDEVTCECKPCKSCDGEGELVVTHTQNNHGETVRIPEAHWFKCPTCHGSGKDSDDCCIHDAEVTA